MAVTTRAERIASHERNPKWQSPPLRIDAVVMSVEEHTGGLVVGIAQDDHPELFVTQQCGKKTTRVVLTNA